MKCPHCNGFVRFPDSVKLTGSQIGQIINDPENRTMYWARRFKVDKSTILRIKRKRDYLPPINVRPSEIRRSQSTIRKEIKVIDRQKQIFDFSLI